MYCKRLGGLIVLNVVLAALLAMVAIFPEPAAGQSRRRSGDYIMVAADTPGQVEHTIYITDLNNGAMLATMYRSRGQSKGRFEVIGVRNIVDDFERAESR